MIDYEGKSYFFYHNGALPGGGSYKRSVCIEEFTYNADGSIPKLPPTTGGVVKGVRNLNPYDTVQAETICWESGIKTAKCSEGGMAIDSISNGDYIKVEGVDFKEGAKLFEARVASGGSGGSIELRLGSQTGTLIGTCEITGTTGWQTWSTKSCTITDAKGVNDLYLVFKGGAGRLFTFNWWKFTSPVQTRTSLQIIHSLDNIVSISSGKTVNIRLNQVVDLQQYVDIDLYDVSGRLVSTLFKGEIGQAEIRTDLKNIHSGMYFLRVRSGQMVTTKPITIQ
jgi:hypothetical protein